MQSETLDWVEDVDEIEDSVVADVSELPGAVPVVGLSVPPDCVLLDSDVLVAMLGGVLAVLWVSPVALVVVELLEDSLSGGVKVDADVLPEVQEATKWI